MALGGYVVRWPEGTLITMPPPPRPPHPPPSSDGGDIAGAGRTDGPVRVFSRRLGISLKGHVDSHPGAPWMSPAFTNWLQVRALGADKHMICWNQGRVCTFERRFRVHRESARGHSLLLRERHGGRRAIRTTRFPVARDSASASLVTPPLDLRSLLHAVMGHVEFEDWRGSCGMENKPPGDFDARWAARHQKGDSD